MAYKRRHTTSTGIALAPYSSHIAKIEGASQHAVFHRLYFCKHLQFMCFDAAVISRKETRAASFVANCTDTDGLFDSSCWDTLDILDSLMNRNKTTLFCAADEYGTDQDSSTCYEPDEPWSTRFLRLAHGIAGANCPGVIAQTCSCDPTLSSDFLSSVVPPVDMSCGIFTCSMVSLLRCMIL